MLIDQFAHLHPPPSTLARNEYYQLQNWNFSAATGCLLCPWPVEWKKNKKTKKQKRLI